MLLNPRGIADYSVALADVVERVIDAGEFPVVLGGDCSIVLARRGIVAWEHIAHPAITDIEAFDNG